MIAEKMVELGKRRSVIREIFEYSQKRAKEIGKENVFDFSIGNPSVPPPACVREAIVELLAGDPVKLHGYTSAPGDPGVRQTLADYINHRFGTALTAGHLYMTAGAAASLAITIRAITLPGDEFILFAPFFPEYRCFVETAGAQPVVVLPADEDLQIDLADFAAAVTPRTKAIILNSPNNPSGVVFSEETVSGVCAILKAKSAEYGRPIYLISDEPYRELVYDDVEVPYLPNYYDNTFVCDSYSKSLSLPGERIGYIAVSERMQDGGDVYAAINGAGRSLGYVCAPSLFQHVVARCLGATADLSIYKKNRDLLYGELTKLGFRCVKPAGAFYLFVRTPEPDASQFCEVAKKHELLLVPGDDFGCPGYVRIAYCVNTEQVVRSLPAFARLAAEYA